MKRRDVYSVRGSGWFAVPADRVNDIAKLREEFHDQELRMALMLARYRRTV